MKGKQQIRQIEDFRAFLEKVWKRRKKAETLWPIPSSGFMSLIYALQEWGEVLDVWSRQVDVQAKRNHDRSSGDGDLEREIGDVAMMLAMAGALHLDDCPWREQWKRRFSQMTEDDLVGVGVEALIVYVSDALAEALSYMYLYESVDDGDDADFAAMICARWITLAWNRLDFLLYKVLPGRSLERLALRRIKHNIDKRKEADDVGRSEERSAGVV